MPARSLMGAFVWRGWAEQGRPSLLGLTSRCGRQTPTGIPSVIEKVITGCAAGSAGEALQPRTHNGERRVSSTNGLGKLDIHVQKDKKRIKLGIALYHTGKK